MTKALVTRVFSRDNPQRKLLRTIRTIRRRTWLKTLDARLASDHVTDIPTLRTGRYNPGTMRSPAG